MPGLFSPDKSGGQLSERRSVLPDIIESTEYEPNNRQTDIGNNTPKATVQDNTSIPLAAGNHAPKVTVNLAMSGTLTPQTISYEGQITPSTIPIYQAGQDLQLSSWPHHNMLHKGHNTYSSFHGRNKFSIPGSVMSGNIFKDTFISLDNESRMLMKKREIMLLERERFEYQQLLDQEAFNSLPERSPRVQAPTKLAKALAALQNPELLSNDNLRDMDYSMADQKATEVIIDSILLMRIYNLQSNHTYEKERKKERKKERYK